MSSQEIIKKLNDKINKETHIAPCLFFGKNKQLLSTQVQNIASALCESFWVPKTYIFTLIDSWEKIKISEIKSFLELSNSNPGYKFQIFIIENISRLTVQAANSCLKKFEEPWIKNLFFLTNTSESGVLDTILSRTQVFDLSGQSFSKKNEFFYSMIKNYVEKNNSEIFSYFFRNKVEKEDNIIFLENLILYAKENFCFIDLLEEINEDITAITNNNVSSKYIVDKYLLKIG